jgi:predicted nucleic acid-binding protein
LTVFADSSALVKLYSDEADADLVRAQPLLVVASIARVEVPAAFWRKSRTGGLSVEDAGVLADAFAEDWHAGERLCPVAVRATVLERAAGLVAVHGLRAYDAVQLGCALEARAADPQLDAFLGFDRALQQAAVREGWHALP